METELTENQKLIYLGKICPYCGAGTKVVSEEYIYGKSYKNKSMICCNNYPVCNSYCGTHKEDGTALGRLADKLLRQHKKVAHDWFDRIWREKWMERNEAYDWLSDQIGTPREHTHIGVFNIKTCKKVIQVCIKYLDE